MGAGVGVAHGAARLELRRHQCLLHRPRRAGPDGDAVLIAGDDAARYRYEVLPVGQGTLLVQYGYTDVKHSNAFVRSFMRRQPMMEHGLALAAQMMFVTAMRDEAIRRAGAPRVAPPTTQEPPSFAPLLARGQVAVMRRGRRSERARAHLRRRAARRGGDRARRRVRVVRAGRRQELRARGDGVYLEMSLPIVTWASTWAMRPAEHAVDGAALDGDLRGAHFRWDLSARTPKETLAVYRVRQELEAGSVLLRKLFAFQPSLRQGINVALALVWMRAIRGRAEGWR